MTPEQQKEFFKQSFTLKGRIFHPNLLKAVAREEGKRETFNTMFAWEQTSNPETMQALNAFLMKAKELFHPSVPMQAFVNPIKKYETYMRQDGKPNPDYLKGCYWLNAQSGKDFPPPVVDAMRQPIINEAEVYSGRNAVINVAFYNIDGAKGGKRGIGCNVNAVMLLEGGDKVASGGVSVNIDKIFGGFASDMGANSEAPSWPPQTNLNSFV
jgi:hypothetical protein